MSSYVLYRIYTLLFRDRSLQKIGGALTSTLARIAGDEGTTAREVVWTYARGESLASASLKTTFRD